MKYSTIIQPVSNEEVAHTFDISMDQHDEQIDQYWVSEEAASDSAFLIIAATVAVGGFIATYIHINNIEKIKNAIKIESNEQFSIIRKTVFNLIQKTTGRFKEIDNSVMEDRPISVDVNAAMASMKFNIGDIEIMNYAKKTLNAKEYQLFRRVVQRPTEYAVYNESTEKYRIISPSIRAIFYKVQMRLYTTIDDMFKGIGSAFDKSKEIQDNYGGLTQTTNMVSETNFWKKGNILTKYNFRQGQTINVWLAVWESVMMLTEDFSSDVNYLTTIDIYYRIKWPVQKIDKKNYTLV